MDWCFTHCFFCMFMSAYPWGHLLETVFVCMGSAVTRMTWTWSSGPRLCVLVRNQHLVSGFAAVKITEGTLHHKGRAICVDTGPGCCAKRDQAVGWSVLGRWACFPVYVYIILFFESALAPLGLQLCMLSNTASTSERIWGPMVRFHSCLCFLGDLLAGNIFLKAVYFFSPTIFKFGHLLWKY